MSILGRIDDTLADRCACGCGQPTTVSAWYATEDCQRRYHSTQATNPQQVYDRPDDLSGITDRVPLVDAMIRLLDDAYDHWVSSRWDNGANYTVCGQPSAIVTPDHVAEQVP